MHVSNSNNNSNNNHKVYLNHEQTEKLKHVLDRPIPIYSSSQSSFPTLNLTPRYFLRQVLCKLKENSIDITSVRLNGGGASYVLVKDSNFIYRDIDILIHIQTPLSSEQKTTLFSSNNQPYLCDVWTIIKYVICSCLLEHIHHATSTEQTSQQYTHNHLSNVLDTYARKNIKISSEQDSWALLSLQNYSGQNLELKFVENLKRQWQFSVDSFQINLEPLLFEMKSNSHSSNRHIYKCPSVSSITRTIKTKSLIIDAINGLTIIKKEYDDDDNQVLKTSDEKLNPSTSPLQFGFFTPSTSPSSSNTIDHENNVECQTLATITTISTSQKNNLLHEYHSRSSKSSVSTLNEESTNSSLQFHLSITDDTDDGIVSDADDSLTEDDDQVFRTPVDTNSAPSSPATIVAADGPSSPSFIEVFSVYKDLHQALDHLHKKQIATYAPETMRGGGLLKYCDLLAQNYKVHDVAEMLRMERYMCSRFFIDYKTEPKQRHVINQYVTTHFIPLSITTTEQSTQRRTNQPAHTSKSSSDENHVNNARLCLLFFDHLFHVIQQSTVCLTHHDKQITLMTINNLKDFYLFNYKHLFLDDNYQQHHHYQQQQQQQRYQTYPHYHHHHYSSSSSNSSRSRNHVDKFVCLKYWTEPNKSSSPSSSSSNSYRYYGPNNYRRPYNSNHRHYNMPRQSSNSSYYHPHGSRAYPNQSILTPHYQRRV